MRNELEEKFKSYHIILLSCLLASLMILNSNYVNNQRQEIKSKQQSEEFFTEMLNLRKLSNENPKTEEVCSRASDDLNDYYKTGDLSKIDIDDDEIECEDKDKSYMKNLIEIVKGLANDKTTSTGDGNSDGRRLRNLASVDKDKLIDYLMRTLPFLIFLVFGILSIFGWIICGICCCCDCCCCCCCKKESCKVPCFIFTYVFYALVVAVCVYGLTQSKKIFVGLANTECSILKFFGEVLHGEIKTETPRWAGIDPINTLLGRLKNNIIDLENNNALTRISNGIHYIGVEKNQFHNNMKAAGESFFIAPDSDTYKSHYIKNYEDKDIEGYPLEDKYILDVVKGFGRQVNNDGHISYEPDHSTLYNWNEEFSTVSGNADGFMEIAQSSFSNIFNEDNFGTIKNSLDDGVENLGKLTKPFTDAEKKIGDILGDYAGYIDKYGKMSVTIVFSVLMVINIALGVLMLLIYMFSSKTCADCCCMRCLFKFCTHILWNVLSLMIILTFIIGSSLGLVGTIGADMMSLVTYIMSTDNFGSSSPLLLDKLKGDAKRYIRRCIHGDGNIAEDMGLDTSLLNSFNDIYRVESDIRNAITEFDDIKENCHAFEIAKQTLQNESSVDGNTQLMPSQVANEDRKVIIYKQILTKINDLNEGKIKWDVETSNDLSCDGVSPEEITYFKPSKCKPYEQIAGKTDLFKKYASILKDIDGMVEYANNDDNTITDSVINVINKLKGQYTTFLSTYTSVLDDFLVIIGDITNLIRDYSGDNDVFSFINGKFIATNLKIILKYLKYSLGVDLYTVGVCLIVVGFSLALSVCSTIILIIIINIELKKNMDAKRLANTENVPDIQPNFPQQAITYDKNY